MCKILVSAYACQPNHGSEAGVGWNWIVNLSRRNNVIVITRLKSKTELEKVTLPNVRFHYVDLPSEFLFWKKGKIGIWVYYFIWQILGFIKAKKICKYEKIDLVHHVSFMSIRLNFTPFLGIPSVIGPVGGLQTLPSGFYKFTGRPIREWFRTLLSYKIKISPIYNFYFWKTNRIVLANSDNMKFIPTRFHKKVSILQIGCNFPVCNPKATNQYSPINLYWGGILTRWKGLEIVLRALEKIQVEYKLTITGKGEDEGYFFRQFARKEFQNKIEYLGWIDREEQKKIFEQTDIFMFTSLHETTGAILLEAMSYGIPSVVVDYGGPGEIIIDECGIKVKPQNPNQTILDFRKGIEYLAKNPELRYKMGWAAIKRIQSFYNWDKKGEQMNAIYREVLAQHENRRRT